SYRVQHAIISSLAQSPEYLGVTDQISVYLDARILLGKSSNDIWQEREPRRLHGADPHFSCGGIRQEFNVPDALLQIIEHRNTAFEERVAKDRRLDALGAAIDKPNAQRTFKIGDHLGDRGMGNAELSGCLGHAPALNDC